MMCFRHPGQALQSEARAGVFVFLLASSVIPAKAGIQWFYVCLQLPITAFPITAESPMKSTSISFARSFFCPSM